MSDILDQRNYSPYKVQGRWYKFSVESDGSTQTLTTSDIDGAYVTSNAIKLPVGWHCVEMTHDIHFTGGSSTFVPGVKYYTTGQQGVSIPTASAFDYADMYMFGYKDR